MIYCIVYDMVSYDNDSYDIKLYHNLGWYDIIQNDFVSYDIVYCDTTYIILNHIVQYHMMQDIWCNIILNSIIHVSYDTLLFYKMLHWIMWSDIIPYNTMQIYHVVWYNSIFNDALYHIIRCHIISYTIIWYSTMMFDCYHNIILY